ncbi:MAG TPA: zinc metallopeptidase [Planctomycetes bacterium]|nr:zinc metallopeptidase [Planctomycetota bacterium]
MLFDPRYLLFVGPAFLLAIWAGMRVRSAFAKGSMVALMRNVRGADVARTVLNAAGLHDVAIEEIPGTLTDHYDPRQKVLRLSSPVFHGSSAAAAGVAAHEAGHALQHASGYAPVLVRNGLLPLAALGGQLALPMFFIGLFAAYSGLAGLSVLMTAGIVLFGAVVLFHVVTLPVEVNASRRALAVLAETGILVRSEEIDAAKDVLTAAALTYLAAALQALLTFIYLLSRRR